MAGEGLEGSAFRAGPTEEPDRYHLGPAVGAGTEGVLYRATVDVDGSDVPVAVKMLHPGHHATFDRWASRWQEQAELLRHLAAPGLVKVRDAFAGPLPHGAGGADPSTKSLYLVMDWVDGVPLWEWVRGQHGASAEQLLLPLVAVAAGLDLLHSGQATAGQSIVHGDVKPGNVLLTGTHSVLVDLGSVRPFDAERHSGTSGTAGYVAPEVATTGVWGVPADRYALGCTAVAVLSGAEPPASATNDQLRSMLEAAEPCAGRPDLIDHVMTMVAEDPATRPVGCANWIAQLRGSSLAITPGDATLPPLFLADPRGGARRRAGGSKRRRGTLLAAVALVVALITGVGVAVALGGDPDAEQVGAGPRASTTLGTPDSSTSSTAMVEDPGAGDGSTDDVSTGPTVGDMFPPVLGFALRDVTTGATTAMRLPGCTGRISMELGPPGFESAYSLSSEVGEYRLIVPEQTRETGPQQFEFRCERTGVVYAGELNLIGYRPPPQNRGSTLPGGTYTIGGTRCGTRLPSRPVVDVVVSWIAGPGTTWEASPSVLGELARHRVDADANGYWPEVNQQMPDAFPEGATALMIEIVCRSGPGVAPDNEFTIPYAYGFPQLGYAEYPPG